MSIEQMIEFVRQCIDEDERVAQRAGSRATAWPASGTWHLEGVEHDVVGEEEAFCHPHNVEHIVRHDPARVLAEVDAKRRILDRAELVWKHSPSYTEAATWRHVVRYLALPYVLRSPSVQGGVAAMITHSSKGN